MKFEIWYQDNKTGVQDVAEVVTFDSQEEADNYASDCDYEDFEYWAVAI